MVRRVDELEVSKKAYRVSLEICRAGLGFPKIEQYALADQLRRSSKSVVANLAEGFGKQSYSKGEFKRFIYMALGGADEVRIWLRYGLDLGYISDKDWQRWCEECEEIARMLQGLARSLKPDA